MHADNPFIPVTAVANFKTRILSQAVKKILPHSIQTHLKEKGQLPMAGRIRVILDAVKEKAQLLMAGRIRVTVDVV